jgi:hypothetical protein
MRVDDEPPPLRLALVSAIAEDNPAAVTQEPRPTALFINEEKAKGSTPR